MKKLSTIILAVSTLLSLNLNAMESSDTQLREKIEWAKTVMSRGLSAISYKNFQYAVDTFGQLIEDILAAKLEGRLQDVPLSFIKELKEFRNTIKEDLEQQARKQAQASHKKQVQKPVRQPIKPPQPVLRSIERISMQELINELIMNPPESTVKDIQRKEDYLRRQVENEKGRKYLKSPTNQPNLANALTELLNEISIAQLYGYVDDITLANIQELTEERDKALQDEEEMRQWREEMRRSKTRK